MAVSAAAKIQATYRGKVARREVRQKLILWKSAKRIQRVVRGRRGRRIAAAHSSRERALRSARRMQAAVRGRQARNTDGGVNGAGDGVRKAKVRAERLLAGKGRGWTEVFQVIHKAALYAIHKEWQRRAPRKANQMYEEVKDEGGDERPG